jgi:hypothetical protein
MSAVTQHLEQRGSAFELLPHRQAYTSNDKARALGIDAGEVLKTLAVRTGPAMPWSSSQPPAAVAAPGPGDAGRPPRPAGQRGGARPRLRRLPVGRPAPAGGLARLRGVRRFGGLEHDLSGVCGWQPDRVGQDGDPGAVRQPAGHDRAAGQAGGPGQRRPGRSAAGGAAGSGRRRTPGTASEVANCKGGVSTPLPGLQRPCVRTPNFAPDGSRRPAQTPVCTAVGRH